MRCRWEVWRVWHSSQVRAKFCFKTGWESAGTGEKVQDKATAVPLALDNG